MCGKEIVFIHLFSMPGVFSILVFSIQENGMTMEGFELNTFCVRSNRSIYQL